MVTSAPSAWTASTEQLLTELAVHQHRACAAVGGVASDGRTGLADGFPQVVDQQQTGFDVIVVADAVNGDGDLGHARLLWRRRLHVMANLGRLAWRAPGPGRPLTGRNVPAGRPGQAVSMTWKASARRPSGSPPCAAAASRRAGSPPGRPGARSGSRAPGARRSCGGTCRSCPRSGWRGAAGDPDLAHGPGFQALVGQQFGERERVARVRVDRVQGRGADRAVIGMAGRCRW